MKIVLILFLCGVNYAVLTTALVFRILENMVENELYLNLPQLFNTTHDDCVWREPFKDRKLCGQEVRIWLNSNGYEEEINSTDSKWLRKSIHWDSTKENVIFIHGYGAGDGSQATLFLRDAFIESGDINFFRIDYGLVSRTPCYIQLVQNIKYVSYCLASYLRNFLASGMHKHSITCIGHSMGAHVCGLLRRYLQIRIKKIIGLDPALPLITESVRLSWRDAKLVHTIQTNAGYYGDMGAIGHLDICVNNGLMQPFCAHSDVPHLCSHLYALCFLAQSLFDKDHQLQAHPCTEVCPHLGVFQAAGMLLPHHRHSNGNSSFRSPDNILLGVNIPDSARGSYCMSSVERPFCPTNKNKIGTKRCCSVDEFFNNDYIPIET